MLRRRLTLALALAGGAALSGCSSGPPLADAIGTVARIRVDASPDGGERRQYFVDPKDIDLLLRALGPDQRLHGGARFKDNEFPTLGLTFFDAQGTPHATLNFSGPLGAHNELYKLAFSAEYLGAVTPADPAELGRILERTAPK
jgi:hypothetical protein